VNIFDVFGDKVRAAIAAARMGAADGAVWPIAQITVERPRDPNHGDLSTNAAMVLAKPTRRKPHEIADILARQLHNEPDIIEVSIAGPGFINLRLDPAVWRRLVPAILTAGSGYGQSTRGGGMAMNVEYVSANPTGPMHVGHARGAVVGDALAGLLAKAGYDVRREYYINDAGSQVQTLGRSLHHRYLQLLGVPVGPVPEGMYPGEYLIPIAQAMVDAHGDTWRDRPEVAWLDTFREAATAAMMAMIKDDLTALGVRHDIFRSERMLVTEHIIDTTYARLQDRGLIYTGVLKPPKGKQPDDWEPRPQTLFKATDFGDDVDRPLKKSDNSWTYFALDIAYHCDKYARGFTRMVNVWGADHGGHVLRMKAALKAVTNGQATLDIRVCQMVRLMDGGVPIKMSKRAGNFITLRSLIDEVGADAVRFSLLTRKDDTAMDFDLRAVRAQSKDNPVFYVQYAHARCCSALRKAAEAFSDQQMDDSVLAGADLDRLSHPREMAVIQLLAQWPVVVESAAEVFEVHRVAFYLYDLAAALHDLWTAGRAEAGLRFVVSEDWEHSRAKLALVRAVALTLQAGLAVCGVSAPTEMSRDAEKLCAAGESAATEQGCAAGML
jgi:arginyl-tRNA synthetase